MEIIKSISTVYHMVRLVINPNDNVKSLLFIGDTITQTKASKEAVRLIFSNDLIFSMYKSKLGLKQLRLTDLMKYGENSFGRDVFKFYKDRKLQVYSMKDPKNLTPEVYVSERIRKIHDMLHVVLGYDTDLIGEAKVNAFVSNNLRMPMSFLIVFGIFIKYFLKKPFHLQQLIDELLIGWNAGERYKNVLSIDWDAYLEKTTIEVRDLVLIKDKIIV